MSEYSFTYRNDSFSLSQAAESVLYVEAGKSGIALLIARNGNLMAWKDKIALADLAADSNLANVLTAPFKSTIIGLVPELLTLIPNELFDIESTADYARVLDVHAEDRVFAGKLDNENHIVYKVDHTVTNALASRFSLQNTVPLYRGWLTENGKGEPGNSSLYLDITEEQLAIANYNGGKLRFFNTFKASDVNDILYYCIFVVDQLDMKPDYTTLMISGNCPAGDFQRLGEFFQVVKYNELRVVDVPMGVPPHQLLTLSALS